MHLKIEFEQKKLGVSPNAPTRWAAYVKQGDMKGSDLLKGRFLTEKREAEIAAKGELDTMLAGYTYTVEFE